MIYYCIFNLLTTGVVSFKIFFVTRKVVGLGSILSLDDLSILSYCSLVSMILMLEKL